MSELVTSASAISHPNLFAPRQQVLVVQRTDSVDGQAVAPENNDLHTNTAPTASANRHEEAAPSLAQPTQAQSGGPSRARVEIRSLDLGLTPAEVVGTPDVLQRFDSNGDGRVDLLESDKATLVRQNLFTFAGVGNPAGETEITAPPVIVSRDDAAPAAAGNATEETAPGQPKKFFVSVTPDGRPAAHKFADAREAAAGGTTATVAVSRKFYGQGTEAVAGAVHGAPARLYDKAAVLRAQQAARDSGGEVRLYDKVAQSGTQNRQQSSGGTLHERARQIAEAINGAKKTVLVQVNAYHATAAANIKQAALLVESTDLTA
ncbi:MAG: hypothetical protein K1X51_13695 [Rhodospirillaceae bacterium]|nr:hypothetical protein [Rhodospirillaceae bacterium]